MQQNRIIPPLVILSMVILFTVFPNLDLLISGLFFDVQNQEFVYAQSSFTKLLFFLIQLTLIIFVLSVCFSGLRKLLKHKSLHPKYYRPEIFIGLTAALGPGLFVHEFLKTFVGRPRPVDIKDFGGESLFQNAFNISTQCTESCSFVSGHSSIGFIFITLAFVSTKENSNKFLVLGTMLGLFFGLIRVIQGAHFTSDVVFAGVIVYLTAIILDKIIKPHTNYNR